MRYLENLQSKWDRMDKTNQFYLVLTVIFLFSVLMALFMYQAIKMKDMSDQVVDARKARSDIISSCEQTTVVHVDGVYYKCVRVYDDQRMMAKLSEAVKGLKLDGAVGDPQTRVGLAISSGGVSSGAVLPMN